MFRPHGTEDLLLPHSPMSDVCVDNVDGVVDDFAVSGQEPAWIQRPHPLE